MSEKHKSSSEEQVIAEQYIFEAIEKRLQIKLEHNRKIYLADNPFTYIQPDFYSEEYCIVGEIFSHIGKPKKAQNNKIANDIMKMLLLEKITEKTYRKIIVVCDEIELEKLNGKSVLAETIRQFGIEIIYIEIEDEMRNTILEAQKRQTMVNA